MKKMLVLIFSLYLFGHHLHAQENNCIKAEKGDKTIIDLPPWFADGELETIRKIEAQDSIEYSDYIQLAVSYAQLDAEESIVEKMIELSLIANWYSSCKMLTSILHARFKWNIATKYGSILSEKLKEYECN